VFTTSFRPYFLLASLAAFATAVLPPAAAQVPAAAYVICDNTSGYVLDQANATRKLQVASLTKIATAMVVLDWAAAKSGDVNQLATVPSSAATCCTPR
jgi:D-alanyl-D-alanine carboxypeptidase (penicillin-binding protein 5/6)